jgi:HSP20 family molecular chaperone IbpA
MKTPIKIITALAMTVSLSLAGIQLTSGNSMQSPATDDPFAQLDKIFELQMRQMRQMQQQMDAMFRNFEQTFQSPSLMQTPMLVHSSGVLSSGFQDKGDHYALAIRINDLNNSKVNITSENGMITITTTTNKKEERTKGKYGKIISYANSSSTQSFTLPPDADEATIKAEQKGNTITITLKKKKGTAPTKTKTIPIVKKGNQTKS